MKTLAELANPGIETIPTYEAGKPIGELAREMGDDVAEPIIKLASNENALGPSPKAVRAMKQVAGGMHRYPDGQSFELRRALALKLRVSADMILLGNGSNEIIELLGRVFLNPSVSVVVGEYSFAVYRMVAASHGAAVISVPMPDLEHDLNAMRRAIRPNTRLVFIGNPNNPTGTMVDREALDRFIRTAPQHVIICLDEAYVELVPLKLQPDNLKHVRRGARVIVLRTFSKTYGLAGLRLGYGVASRDAVRLLNRMRQPFNISAMAQAAGVAALADDAHVSRTRRMVAMGQDYLRKALDLIGLPYLPGEANFMLVRVGDGRAVFEALLRRGVIVRPVDTYGLPEYVRVTIGTPAENKRFIATLAAVLGHSGKMKRVRAGRLRFGEDPT